MIQIFPKAFFFDFDGVITNTEPLHMLSTRQVLEPYGIVVDEEHYFKSLFGLDDWTLFRQLFEQQHKTLEPDLLNELVKRKHAVFMTMVKDGLAFFDGVTDLIKRLVAKKVPLAVVSGALTSEIQACLSLGGLSGFFEFVIGADMVKRTKPDPEAYFLAFNRMQQTIPNLTRQECWALEDSPTGLRAAQAAGLKTIGITNTTAKKNLMLADVVVAHYKEIVVI